MDRSIGIASGRRLSIALLLILSVSVPGGSRAVWDVYLGRKNLGVAIQTGLTSRL